MGLLGPFFPFFPYKSETNEFNASSGLNLINQYLYNLKQYFTWVMGKNRI